MSSKPILPLLIAALIATLLAEFSDRRGFEELTARAAIVDQASALGTKCPLSKEYIDTAEIGLLSICLKYGLAAYEAAQRYPETAARVFSVYGEDEVFQQVLDRYGHPVIPVIAYFVENGSREFQIRQAVADVVQQIWAGKEPTWKLADITREQVGLIAIYRLATRGNEMLAEFEIVDGRAKRKPMTRIMLGLKDLLLGGVGDIETILVRGERLPSWKEVGLAVLDVTVIAGGVGAVAKVARVGVGTAEVAENSTVRLAAEGTVAEKSTVRLAAEGATAEKSTVRLAAEGAYEAVSLVGKTAVAVSPIAFAYVAITRPQLIASAGGWIAEQLGADRSVGIFVVYWIGVFIVLQFLRPLFWFARAVGRPIFGLARYAYNGRRGASQTPKDLTPVSSLKEEVASSLARYKESFPRGRPNLSSLPPVPG
jgi:hypothetical protein